ncbi:MAG: type II toxin-antitoxin system RelE/ParE family toxin [Acidobacteria bacterium]|nr:type II toxin-antitoxin system RelE/ParE family toxin [Acidobacteriota bacterium]
MRFPFTTEAKSQLRAIDRQTALRILEALTRLGESGTGDVSPLAGEWQGCYRLRCGDYRVIFRRIEDGLEVIAIGHRSEIYR